MLSKIDLRDFVEINRGLYAEDAADAALCDMLSRMIAVLEMEQHRHRAAELSASGQRHS